MRRKRALSIAVVMSAAVAVGSCTNQSGGTQGRTVGQVAGGAIGAVGGYFGGRALGMGTPGIVLSSLAAGAIGAWVGGEIGSSLDESDRQQLADATYTAASTGRPQQWSNPDTGVSGKTQVVRTEQKRGSVSVPVLKDRVQEVPPLDLVGEPYRSSGKVNVRGGPGTDFVVVDSLAPGQVVTVTGKVQGKPWYLISQNGVGSGFVSNQLLSPAGTPTAIQETVTKNRTTSEETITESVSVARTCRTVKQTVTLADGTEKQEDITACRGPNGWEIT